MQKISKTILLVLGLFIVSIFASSLASAYPSWLGYNDYRKEYTERYVDDGYKTTYTKKVVDNTPFQSVQQSYTIKNYVYPTRTDSNPVYDYWSYGPYQNWYHLGDRYNDAYYDNSYHPYYHNPSSYYNGQYWDWGERYNPYPKCTGRCW